MFHRDITEEEFKEEYTSKDNLGKSYIEDQFAGKTLKSVRLRKGSEDWDQAKEKGIAPQSSICFEFEGGEILRIEGRHQFDHLYSFFYRLT